MVISKNPKHKNNICLIYNYDLKAIDYLQKTNIDIESLQVRTFIKLTKTYSKNQKAKQLIVKQKYLELLELKQTEQALKVLREEIVQLNFD